MALLTIEKAAEQIGAPRQTLEAWIASGLLPLTEHRLIDEDRPHEVADSVGWLHVSQESWDGAALAPFTGISAQRCGPAP